MQEEVENRTLTLMVNGSKFTGRMFKAAIAKYMAHRKEVKHQKQQKRDTPVVPHGRQTVKQLIGRILRHQAGPEQQSTQVSDFLQEPGRGRADLRVQ